MKIRHIITLLAAFMTLAASCSEGMEDGIAAPPSRNDLSDKLVNGTDGEILPGGILVKLDPATTAAIEDGRFNEIADELLEGIEAASISPAVPAIPENEEAARRYGLHQWFSIGFDESVEPQEAAQKIARSPRVRTVQYNRRIRPVRMTESAPAEMEPSTRSAQPEDSDLMPFNDPYNRYQWNLHNDGTISDRAVAGADVGVKDAWRLTGGDRSVIVAVFDTAVDNDWHEDLRDAIWRNEAEISGTKGIDDDGNGFIDDKYGFNFVRCKGVKKETVNGALSGEVEFTGIKSDPLDVSTGSGHGTHVGGIVAATNNNGVGVSSIAGGTGNGDGVRLMSCQIVQDVAASDAQEAAAWIYAADNGACIAQCSYGLPYEITSDGNYIDKSALSYAAIKYFLDPENSNHPALEGNVAIFAAGNQQYPQSLYPGALSDVISVTAMGWDFLPGGYTNYGPGCNIAAPGGEYDPDTNSIMILSTGASSATSPPPGLEFENGGRSQNYVYMYGTSMACPHVSGVAALGVSYAHKLGKRLTRKEFLSLMLTSVNDMDRYLAGGEKTFYDPAQMSYVTVPLNRWSGKMGTGAIDAWKFLMAIEGTPTFMARKGEKVSINLSSYCNPNGNYSISVDEDSRNSLGLVSEPVVRGGKLEIECSKIGAGKIVLSSSVGKDPEREDGIGGMEYSREISIVSRPFATDNGGWL